jgi:hypothetical protein
MSAISIEGVVASTLPGFDEDLVGYIVAVLEQMELDERQNSDILNEAIVPFIVDSEYASESDAVLLCRKISVAFGGSGFKSGKSQVKDDAPELLSAPVRLQDTIQPEKKTYGGVVFADVDGSSEIASNSEYDAASVPKDLRSKRKIQKENEQLSRKLRLEAARDAERRIEMAAARMAAIRASRQASKSKAHTGVHIDSFSLPHPSGMSSTFPGIYLFHQDKKILFVQVFLSCICFNHLYSIDITIPSSLNLHILPYRHWRPTC